MKALSKHTTTIVAALLLLTGTSQLDAKVPDVLSQIPAEAALVVATQPLAAINTKTDLLAHQLGMPPEQPLHPGDMLGAKLGMAGMIDGSRSLGLAITNLMDAENSLIAFVPVTDAQGALSALQANGATEAANAAGVWNCPAINSSVKAAGRYLLISPTAKPLSTFGQAASSVRLDNLDSDLFSRSDVACRVNLASLMPMFRQMATARLASDAKVSSNPGLQNIANMAIDRLCELKSVSIGLNLGQDGVNISMCCQTQQASKLAAFLSNHPTTDISQLAQLPDNAVYAYALAMNGNKMVGPINAVLDSAFEALAADPNLAGTLTGQDITELKALVGDLYASAFTGAVGVYASAPGAAAMPPAHNQMTLTTMTDASRVLAAGERACPLITRIAGRFGIDLPMAYQKNAGTIAGMSYDQTTVDLSHLPLPPPMLQAMTANLGGGTSYKQEVCKLDDRRIATGVGPGSLEKLVSFVQSGQPGLDKNAAFAKAAKNVHAKANLIQVVDLRQAMQMSLQSMQAQMQAQMQAAQQGQNAQPGMDPMAMSMAMGMMGGLATMVQGTAAGSVLIENGSIQVEAFLPNELVQSVGMIVQSLTSGAAGMPPGGPPAQQGTF